MPAARGTSDGAYPSWPRYSGNTGPKAAIDELQPEEDQHHEQKILEGQNRSEWRPLATLYGPRRSKRLLVHRGDHHKGDAVRAGRDEKSVPQPEDGCEQAADHGTDRRPHALRGLHRANRRRHLLARGRERRHRQGQRSIARKETPAGHAAQNRCHTFVTYAIAVMTMMKLMRERCTSSLLPNRSPTRPHSGPVSAAMAGETPSVTPVQRAMSPTSVTPSSRM